MATLQRLASEGSGTQRFLPGRHKRTWPAWPSACPALGGWGRGRADEIVRLASGKRFLSSKESIEYETPSRSDSCVSSSHRFSPANATAEPQPNIGGAGCCPGLNGDLAAGMMITDERSLQCRPCHQRMPIVHRVERSARCQWTLGHSRRLPARRFLEHFWKLCLDHRISSAMVRQPMLRAAVGLIGHQPAEGEEHWLSPRLAGQHEHHGSAKTDRPPGQR